MNIQPPQTKGPPTTTTTTRPDNNNDPLRFLLTFLWAGRLRPELYMFTAWVAGSMEVNHYLDPE